MKNSRPIIWLAVVALTAALLVVFTQDRDKSKPLELQAFLKGDMAGLQLIDGETAAPELVFFAGQDEEKQLGLDDFKGRVLVLNLWATWCAPCVHELPSLDRLQAELGGDDFEVVALSMDRGGAETVVPFLDELEIQHLGVYTDRKSKTMRALKSASLPITLIIDKNGEMVGRFDGPAAWDGAETKALLKALIAA